MPSKTLTTRNAAAELSSSGGFSYSVQYPAPRASSRSLSEPLDRTLSGSSEVTNRVYVTAEACRAAASATVTKAVSDAKRGRFVNPACPHLDGMLCESCTIAAISTKQMLTIARKAATERVREFEEPLNLSGFTIKITYIGQGVADDMAIDWSDGERTGTCHFNHKCNGKGLVRYAQFTAVDRVLAGRKSGPGANAAAVALVDELLDTPDSVVTAGVVAITAPNAEVLVYDLPMVFAFDIRNNKSVPCKSLKKTRKRKWDEQCTQVYAGDCAGLIQVNHQAAAVLQGRISEAVLTGQIPAPNLSVVVSHFLDRYHPEYLAIMRDHCLQLEARTRKSRDRAFARDLGLWPADQG